MSFKLGVPGRISSKTERPANDGGPSTSRSTSQFQPNVTFGDCDESVRNGPRSLGGMSPSARGHTMKECEEQLSHLHKENFNLKLRIYFLEERVGHRGPPIPGMSAVIEDVELLRAELAEKQQLLCQAATAIDLVEKKQQEEVEKFNMEKQGLQKQLLQLQETSSQRCSELQDEIVRFGDHCQQQLEKVSSLTQHCQQQQDEMSSLAARCQQQADHLEMSRRVLVEVENVSTQCQEQSTSEGACESTQCRHQVLQLADLEEQCKELQANLRERDNRMDELALDLQRKAQIIAEAEVRVKELEEALCEKQPEIQIKVQELRERDSIIEEKQNQIDQQNRVLVEIQITLAEKQKLIDALNSTIASRDKKIAQLEEQLIQIRDASRALEEKHREDSHDLNRARGENEMLKAQLKRMNRSKEERESPRRRCTIQTRDMSPRNKSLIEEAVEGIWNGPVTKVKDELSMLEEKENNWKSNDAREKTNDKTDKFQQFVDLDNKSERKSDTKFSEENYLKLEKEHQKGCEAIQVFISRIKLLAYENDHVKSVSKKREKKFLELKMELQEMRDRYNKAKWEARQFEAEATGVPGTASTLADVKDMTEEENERLWAEVENKNKKLAEMSLERESQVQDLLSSLKEKEIQLEICEKKLIASLGDLGSRDNRITELEKKVYQLQTQIITVPNSKPSKEIANVSKSLAIELESSKNVIDHLEIGLKHCVLDLHSILDMKMWDESTIDNLQDSLSAIFKRKESEILALQHQILLKDLHLKMLQDKVTELGITMSMPTSLPEKCVPINISQYFQVQQPNQVPGDGTKVLPSDLLTLQRHLSMSLNEQTYLHHKVKDLQKQLCNTPDGDSDCSAVATLKSKCDKMRDDACASEVWKKEATKTCTLLVGRLEELAEFLVSLLQHPERLGNLEMKHCRFIKQAVQRSVNLSRQLSMSICHQDENDCSGLVCDTLSFQPKSDINFSLVNRYLDVDDDPSNRLGDLPFESCSTLTLDNMCGFNISEVGSTEATQSASNSLPGNDTMVEQAMIISRLRSQVETLKLEIKQRDIEHHCFMQEHNLLLKSTPLSDSQANAESHSVETMTFYNKNLNPRNPLIQASMVNNSMSTTSHDFGICEDGENDEPVNLTDHIQINGSMIKSQNLFTKSQSLNKSIISSAVDNDSKINICEKPQVLQAQQDALTLSESETWSEPDRQISLARIGLPEESTCLAPSGNAIFRHHYSRTFQEFEESSESSQETAREIIRTPGKRRSDALDMRRLQGRLRGLEQVNEVLKTELKILHQLTPVSNHSPCTLNSSVAIHNESNSSDKPANDEIHQSVEMSSGSNVEQLTNPVITIPSYLLEEIKHQREKLESSLFHNDFIRRQLEDVFFSATGVKPDERKRFKDTTELTHETLNKAQMIEAQLQETEAKAKHLEMKLQEAEGLLSESREQSSRVAEAEKLCGEAHDAVSILHDQVQNLGIQLQKKDAEILEKDHLVVKLENQVSMQKIEIDQMIQEITDLKSESEKRVIQEEERVKELENLLSTKVEEMEKGLLILGNSKACVEEELINANKKLKEAELQREEANRIIEMMKVEFSNKMLKYEETQTRLEQEIKQKEEECNEELDRRSKKLKEAEKQLDELRWVYKAEVERKVKDAERLGSDIEAGLRRQIEISEKKSKEAEEKSKALEADLCRKVQESEKRILDQMVALRQQKDEAMLDASQAALERTKLANEKVRVEQELRKLQTKETELVQEHREAEGRQLAIQEQLNQQLVILERKKCELERRIQDLESANDDLKFHLDRLSIRTDASRRSQYSSRRAASPTSYPRSDGGMFTRESTHLPSRSWGSDGHPKSPDTGRSALSSLVLQHGFSRQHSDFSDYMSEDQEFETIVTQSCSSRYWITTVSGSRPEVCSETQEARNINSPDLGIESDQGRFSSLEANAGPYSQDHASTQKYPVTEMNNLSAVLQTHRGEHSEHVCTEMKEVNNALKRELCQTRRALKETLAQLTAANQRKQNADKAICRQLQKTQNILKKTRGNLQPDYLMLCDDQT